MQVDACVTKSTKSRLFVIFANVRLVVESDCGTDKGGCAERTGEEFRARCLMRGEGGGIYLLGGSSGGCVGIRDGCRCCGGGGGGRCSGMIFSSSCGHITCRG